MPEAALDFKDTLQIFVKLSSICEIAPNCAMDLQNKSNVKALDSLQSCYKVCTK